VAGHRVDESADVARDGAGGGVTATAPTARSHACTAEPSTA
jgi:hypothetical protein